MGTHRTRKPKPADETRAPEALSILRAGGTHADVVRAGIYRTVSASRMAIKRMMARRKAADIDEHREIIGEQLRGLWTKTWPKVEAGDTSVVGAAVRILEAIVRLYGLDAASQALNRVVGVSEAEFAAAALGLLSVTGTRPLVELAGIPEPVQPVAYTAGLDGWHPR